MLKQFSKRSLIATSTGFFISLVAVITYFSWGSGPAPHKPYYVIGRDNSWYPLQVWGKEFNLIAFSNDLFAAISAESGLQFRWAESSTLTLLDNLNREAYDAILTPMRPTILNRDSYLFSHLLFETGLVLVVEKDSPYTSLKDMSGRTIGVTTGYNFTFNAIKASGANDYNLILVNYDFAGQAFDALVNNQVDGIFLGAQHAYSLADRFYGGLLRITTPPLTDEGLRLVTLHDSAGETLMKTFDTALRKLKEDGTYDILLTKWSFIDPEKDYRR